MADFHFLRPYWFFALIPLIAIIWSLRHIKLNSSGWLNILPNHLANHLLVGSEQKAPLPVLLIAITWLISVIALAGPTWQKQPQPVFEAQAGKVIVLDLSMSMRSDDIKPDRLTMARFKAIEIARQIKEGDLGLIAYAGDAFTISPLTPDNKNIINQIPSLSPEIMPVMGSNGLLAIDQAVELLSQAGYQQGDIFWLTDGIHSDEYSSIQKTIADTQYRLLTLGVGTQEGAPIKLQTGELLKDARGSIVVPKLHNNQLKQLSKINQGYYQDISAGDNDIETLISKMQSAEKIKQEQAKHKLGDQWQEAGPWFVLALLPLAAYAFRKGLIYLILVGFLSVPTSFKVSANPLDNAFSTRDQQAYEALKSSNFEQASELAEDKKLKAAALFKQGQYEKAIEAYDNLNDADALYNKANAYANLGELDKAIETYEQALKQQPDFEKAKNNKALAEKLKQQQEQQQNSDQNSEQNSDQNSDQNSEQNNQGQQSQNSQEQNNDQNGQSQDQQNNSEQNQSSEQHSEQNSEQSQNQDQQNSQEQNNQSHRSAQDMAEQQEQEQQQTQSESESNEQNTDSAQQPQAQPAPSQNGEQNGKQSENEQVTAQPRELTPEQRAEQEKNEIYRQLLNKVEDDPSYLIRRKMQLEYEKRRRSNAPKGVTQPW